MKFKNLSNEKLNTFSIILFYFEEDLLSGQNSPYSENAYSFLNLGECACDINKSQHWQIQLLLALLGLTVDYLFNWPECA